MDNSQIYPVSFNLLGGSILSVTFWYSVTTLPYCTCISAIEFGLVHPPCQYHKTTSLFADGTVKVKVVNTNFKKKIIHNLGGYLCHTKQHNIASKHLQDNSIKHLLHFTDSMAFENVLLSVSESLVNFVAHSGSYCQLLHQIKKKLPRSQIMKVEVIMIGCMLAYRDRQSASLYAVQKSSYLLMLPLSHLLLVVNDAVGCYSNSLLATNDADRGKSLMGSLRHQFPITSEFTANTGVNHILNAL